ncbi:lytic transglycosylase domain-containing protein [Zunongwangia sp.]|uniref:lytic transglycosylase domain-containing protein n=1 Tax=Zunongwangia sp. TaxID=1965325 RepID=UPI003AA7F005
MKFIKFGLLIIGAVTLYFSLIEAAQKPQLSKKDTQVYQQTFKKNVAENYTIKALSIPEEIDFAGEQVPLQEPDIRERLDRELLVNTYWQSNALLLLKRAHKYFPIIEPILEQEGVPSDFKYLAVIESGLTQAVSPAQAVGFWQLLRGTGRELGLEINGNVDERYNIEKATRAACEYLKDSKRKFGSWTLAAAAYNAGRAGIARQQERQKVFDYYDLLLGEETGRYMFRILALKEIMKHPHEYGFQFEESDLYQHIPVRHVVVDTAVNDFPDFAKKFNINYKILKIHNPWLREDHLNNSSRKKYSIQIPEEGYYNR